MRFPPAFYQIEREIVSRFPDLRPAQHAWLALWVFGMFQAKSGTESAVLSALSSYGNLDVLRQRLREGLKDGGDRAAPCSVELEVSACFPLLFAWVLALWQGEMLPLALDASLLGDELAVLAVCVLYRGSSIPVAWAVRPANTPDAWLPRWEALLEALRCALPRRLRRMKVVVMTDRGLWSPALWDRLIAMGWHPLMRLHPEITFRPSGRERRKVREWLRGPGHAFLARGVAFGKKGRQREATLVASWETGEEEPWVLLTDLPPDPTILRWYGLRSWIECGFRSLKSMGWQWDRTRRREPKRVERHWLAMAVSQLWALACGTREEDAREAGVPPERLRTPPSVGGKVRRTVSLWRRGIASLGKQFLQGWLWKRLWLSPEPWPDPPFLIPSRLVCIT